MWKKVALVGVALGAGAAAVEHALSSSSKRRQANRHRNRRRQGADVDASDAAATSKATPTTADDTKNHAAKSAHDERPEGATSNASKASKAQLELLSAVDAASEWEDAAFTKSLDASFARAADRVESFIDRVGNADKLRVYALYKQSTAGPCAAPKPRLIDGMTKHAKWSAWKDLGDMTADDAKTQYVELVEELSGEAVVNGAEGEGDGDGGDGDGGDGEDVGGDGGFGGPVFSRPAMPFAESGKRASNLKSRGVDSAEMAAGEGGGGGGGGGAASRVDGMGGGGGGHGQTVSGGGGSGGFNDGGIAEALGGGGGARSTSSSAAAAMTTSAVRGPESASASDSELESHLDPLSEACKRGDVEAVKRAALLGPVDVGARDDQGRTPLHWAADGGHTPVAIALLQLGAAVDAVDAEGQTPLHYAATVELPDMVCLLLESGADPQLEDEDGDTPASLGALEMAKEYAGR